MIKSAYSPLLCWRSICKGNDSTSITQMHRFLNIITSVTTRRVRIHWSKWHHLLFPKISY
ncbi:hypothetical protein HanIR_Chr01g0032111 [Helianthus annuus]|nr:hypothetical protein HanIR_Chr01g0032111 [Helianthus annuus]